MDYIRLLSLLFAIANFIFVSLSGLGIINATVEDIHMFAIFGWGSVIYTAIGGYKGSKIQDESTRIN